MISTTNEDPAYREEAHKLAEVVRYITDQHHNMKGQMPATAAHQEAADAIQQILQENADTLYSALERPYFGRIDYFDKGDIASVQGQVDEEPDDLAKQRRKVYLGITFIPGHDVFSWTAPVAKLWYTQSYEDGYTAPRGYIPTRVDLKRYLRIRESRLEDLNDIFRRQLPAPDTARQGILTEALSGVGSDDGHLQVIVETIEPDQYESIANVSDRVLIVQGAAGSGKSEIGLHRIAYLLSPHNEIPARERPTPDTTLFVGPSQAFLEYAADILPTLGIQEDIEQVRFSEWLIGRLSARTPIRPRIWNDLLARGEMTRFDEEAETFKGSLAMADAIDRHVSETATAVRQRCLRLPTQVPVPGSTLSLATEQFKSLLNGALPSSERGARLNRNREEFIDRVTRLVPLADRGSRLGPGERMDRRRAAARRAVAQWCGPEWPLIDFREEYISLLSDRERMAFVAGSHLSEDVCDQLADSAKRIEAQGFDDSDVGALAYLDHLLNDTIESRYRHVVVDEAQDISPIEFKLLAASSANNWFTVLGDTVQRLTPYRGIRIWRDVERVFGRSEIEVQRARRSYRSSRQITTFNNRILRTFDQNIPAPIPFERDSHRVEYHQHRTTADMYRGIVDDLERVRSLNGLEEAVTAILVRDQSNLNRFQEFCERRDIGGIVLVGQEHHSDSRTLLARIPDVKGLEYDAVIVMGVNDSFSGTFFNKKLLYLATTRAKHYLGIHWSGKQSEILQSISDRAITQYRR